MPVLRFVAIRNPTIRRRLLASVLILILRSSVSGDLFCPETTSTVLRGWYDIGVVCFLFSPAHSHRAGFDLDHLAILAHVED
jgi:hypothetical protein